MSNNTTASGITRPTKYTLLDNNYKYLPRNFTFIPTVSSESNNNDITETVKNALSNTDYYTRTPQDFVYNIKVKDNLGDNIVYKIANKNACVYQIGSEKTAVYKYCTSDTVSIDVLGDVNINNINIGNVTVIKDKDVLEPIATSLSCTEPGTDKKITVPKGYDSLEINSSDVYFRQENNSENQSWVTINNNIVLFSSNIEPCKNIINFSNYNFTIALKDNKYSFNSMIEISLANAHDMLQNNQLNPAAIELILALGNEINALVEAATALDETTTTDLKEAATALKKAAIALDETTIALDETTTALDETTTALGAAKTALEKAATDLGVTTDLGTTATALEKAATDLGATTTALGAATTDLDETTTALRAAFNCILMASLSLKKQKLFDSDENKQNVWKKESSVNDTKDLDSLSYITTKLENCQEALNTDFDNSFNTLKTIYAIYNKKNDNIGLLMMDTTSYDVVVVNDTPINIKEILKYCQNSNIQSIKIVALDTNQEMIMCYNQNKYELVYLKDKEDPNRESILPKGDSFTITKS